MSQKMFKRGRYPKDASLYSNPGAVRPVQQPVATTSMGYAQVPEVPLYNTQSMSQFQAPQNFQNSWQTSTVAPFVGAQSQQQVHTSWSCDPQYSQTTPSDSNVWNWTPENNMYNHNNPPVQQQQQPFHHAEVLKTASQYPPDATRHSFYSTEQPLPVLPENVNYSSHNNWYAAPSTDSKKQNGNQPAVELPQPTWETVAPNISQSEHLPWTYNVPQNTVATSNTAQWPNHSYVQPAVSYSAVNQHWNEAVDNKWQSGRTQENCQTNQVAEAVSAPIMSPPVETCNFMAYQVAPNPIETNHAVSNVASDIESVESHSSSNLKSDLPVVDNGNELAENENSGLNAFFHNSVEENVEVARDSTECVVPRDINICSPNIENIAGFMEQEVIIHPVSAPQSENTSASNSVVNEGKHEDREQFVQGQVVPVPKDQMLPTISSVEEPLNQEVPEPSLPYGACSGAHAQQIVLEDSPDEPLNQQVPAETALSTNGSERNSLIQEESSPFKQPVKSSSTGSIVQQEVPSSNSFLPKTTGQGSFQEVNLETVPDNLERPPDYDDLRKESSLSASFRQHLRSMEKENVLDTSRASLWEDPKLPCVLLAPAAPLQPIVVPLVKNDSLPSTTLQTLESKSSTDVSSVTSALEDLHIKEPAASISFPSPAEKTPCLPTPVPTADACYTPEEVVAKPETLPKPEENFTEPPPPMRVPSPVKDTAHSTSSLDMSRSERYPPLQPPVEKEKHSRSYGDMRSRFTPHEYDPPGYRDHYRSTDRYPDSGPRRVMDNRYASFDERHAFHKDGSRPSSRMSLDESAESRGNLEHGYRKNYSSDYDRPPSRMSESEAYRAQREGHPPYFEPQYNRGSYTREEEYYQRMRGYRGYEYDPYQGARSYYGYYDPYRYNYSSFNYGFYDELYRNDPRYRKQVDEQYREYYKVLGYETDYERSSAYSGRSSANELTKDTSQRYLENDGSSSDMHCHQNYEQDSQVSSYDASDEKPITPACRLTPIKFNCAHALVHCTSSGQLLMGVPKNDTGFPPLVEIHDVQNLTQESESYKELKQFQGPLVRRETHKNDIIEFCVQKVKFFKQTEGIHDRESYVLLWELLILMLRQNGSVAGSDIAELLLKDHEVLRPPLPGHIPQNDNSPAEAGEVPPAPVPAGDASSPDEGIVVTRDKTILNTAQSFDVDKVTRKFREFLLFGHKKDALEWAMKHNLWGHALFLASKMDVRTYANVMTRFANSLALNDPLQTLYQLMSGRQPAAVTCVADKQWGDWRPHLAMILSNPSNHSEVDLKSITTLGDTLAAQGCLPATHFCYLMAQVEFGSYTCKSSKIVLLCADHQLPFEDFATNEAIQCTEIYEYAQSLANPGFLLSHLQAYKFIYATRLVDNGFQQEALHYCEVLTTNFLSNPSAFPMDLINQVYDLALKLKYYDPHYMQGQGEIEEQDDPEWLKALASLLGHVRENQPYNDECFESQPEVQKNAEVYPQNTASDLPPEMPHSETLNESYSTQQKPNAYPNTWITGNILQQQHAETGLYEPQQYSQQDVVTQPLQQPNYPNQWNVNAPKMPEVYYDNQVAKSHDEIQSSVEQATMGQKFNFYGNESSMMHGMHSKERTSSTSSIGLQRDRQDSALSSGSDHGAGVHGGSKSGAEVPKPVDKSEKSRPQVGRSWLGGIFSKLLPKGPNQMILPDDKNPTIVWDPVNNCWINTDSKDEDVSSQPVAPPKDVELISKTPDHSNASLPPMAAASTPLTNKFQRQKVKGMRQNYVDIMNANISKVESPPPPSDLLFPTVPPPHSAANVFVPSVAPINDDQPVDFISTQSYSYGSSQGGATDGPAVPQAPPMFDPAEFDTRRSSMNSIRHSVGPAHRTYPT